MWIHVIFHHSCVFLSSSLKFCAGPPLVCYPDCLDLTHSLISATIIPVQLQVRSGGSGRLYLTAALLILLPCGTCSYFDIHLCSLDSLQCLEYLLSLYDTWCETWGCVFMRWGTRHRKCLIFIVFKCIKSKLPRFKSQLSPQWFCNLEQMNLLVP